MERSGGKDMAKSGNKRETRLELATLCLGSRCSTTELLPQSWPTRKYYAKRNTKSSNAQFMFHKTARKFPAWPDCPQGHFPCFQAT